MKRHEPAGPMSLLLLGLAAAMVSTACSPTLEFADWVLEVPENTPVIEYAAVPAEERTTEIRLDLELTLGGGPQVVLYRPMDVAVDDDGRIYVLDAGADAIEVFEPDGRHAATWGGPGQGPGELQSPISIAFATDRIIVSDSVSRRLPTWSLRGELLSDSQPTELLQFLSISGVAADGTFIGRYIDSGAGELRYVVAVFTPEGEKVRELFDYPNPPDPGLPPVAELLPLRARFAHSGYLSTADRDAGAAFFAGEAAYQLLAFAPEGRALWALRVSGSPRSYPAEVVDEVMAEIREHAPDAQVSDFNWPDSYPALDRIATDGRDRLFVYPYVADATRDDIVPVDVYTYDGERLFSGSIRNVRWNAARGDAVYVIGSDPATEETVVQRYRLSFPEGG